MKTIPIILKIAFFFPLIGLVLLLVLKDTIKSDDSWCSKIGSINYTTLLLYNLYWIVFLLSIVYLNL